MPTKDLKRCSLSKEGRAGLSIPAPSTKAGQAATAAGSAGSVDSAGWAARRCPSTGRRGQGPTPRGKRQLCPAAIRCRRRHHRRQTIDLRSQRSRLGPLSWHQLPHRRRWREAVLAVGWAEAGRTRQTAREAMAMVVATAAAGWAEMVVIGSEVEVTAEADWVPVAAGSAAVEAAVPMMQTTASAGHPRCKTRVQAQASGCTAHGLERPRTQCSACMMSRRVRCELGCHQHTRRASKHRATAWRTPAVKRPKHQC